MTSRFRSASASANDRSENKHHRSPRASSSRIDGRENVLPQAKIQALERFVKFGRKGKQKEKENESRKTTEFPPSTWFDTSPTSLPVPAGAGTVNTSARPELRHDTPPQPPPRPNSTGSQLPKPIPEISFSTSRSTVDLVNTPSITAPSSHPGTHQSPLDSEDQSAPEPLTLARRIQTLLSLRTGPPTPSITNATTSFGAASSSSEAAGLTTPGGSVPPAPITVADSHFLALLGNTGVMSGSLDKGRQSVFAILDRLRRPSTHAAEVPAYSSPSSVSEEEQGEEEYEDESSIMLYGPLVPSEDSEVELAASDIMSVFDDGDTLEFERPARPLSFIEVGEQLTHPSLHAEPSPTILEEPTPQDAPNNAGQPGVQEERSALGWFDTWKGKVIESGKLVSDKVAESTKSWKVKMAEGRKVMKTKTRWVPSPDKISFQATWWGYRLYLPPPVLDVLNNKRLEAAKRAAIITTALQWLLGQVPLSVVPPQFRPGFLIAQRLVPYIGYIGGFVAWSWGAMKSFDKGYGIVLTATWLLPVALIPGTWEANERRPSPDSAPVPPNTEANSPPEASASGLNSAPMR